MQKKKRNYNQKREKKKGGKEGERSSIQSNSYSYSYIREQVGKEEIINSSLSYNQTNHRLPTK